MRLERPSARQRELMAAMVEHGGELPAVYQLQTTDAMMRRGWVEVSTPRLGGEWEHWGRVLRITTRGRWALRTV